MGPQARRVVCPPPRAALLALYGPRAPQGPRWASWAAPPTILLVQMQWRGLLGGLAPEDWSRLRRRYSLADRRVFGDHEAVVSVYEPKAR